MYIIIGRAIFHNVWLLKHTIPDKKNHKKMALPVRFHNQDSYGNVPFVQYMLIYRQIAMKLQEEGMWMVVGYRPMMKDTEQNSFRTLIASSVFNYTFHGTPIKVWSCNYTTHGKSSHG